MNKKNKILAIGFFTLIFSSMFIIGAAITGLSVYAQAPANSYVTHGEFAKQMVQRLALESKGIPADATWEDYFSLLRGGKSVEVEAEVQENVSTSLVKNAFADAGFWLSTVKNLETIPYNVEFPHSGVYWLRGNAKGSTEFWTIDNEVTEILIPSAIFQWIDLKRYVMSRSMHAVRVAIPKNGGLDKFFFSADNLRGAEPSEGWDANRPLTYGSMAEVMIKLMRRENRLPEDKDSPFHYQILEKGYQSGANPAVAKFNMRVDEAGVYSMKVAVKGDKPVTFYVKGGRIVLKPLAPGAIAPKPEERQGAFNFERFINPMKQNVQIASSKTGNSLTPGVSDRPRVFAQAPGADLQDMCTSFFELGDHAIEANLPPYTTISSFHRIKHGAARKNYLEMLKAMGVEVGDVDDLVTPEALAKALSNREFLVGIGSFMAEDPLLQVELPAPMAEPGAGDEITTPQGDDGALNPGIGVLPQQETPGTPIGQN